LLAHAFAETIDPPRHDLRQIDFLEPVHRAAARVRPGQSLQRAEIGHHVDDGELRVESALFREIAEPIEIVAGPRMPERQDAPLVWPDDVHQDSHERALAGPVGAQQAEDLALLDIEGDALERWRLPVALGQAVEGNDGHARNAILCDADRHYLCLPRLGARDPGAICLALSRGGVPPGTQKKGPPAVSRRALSGTRSCA